MKVGKKTVKIGETWFEIEVHYSSKCQEFSAKGLPSDFANFSPTWSKSPTLRTESDLLKTIQECGAEYAINKTKSRKVIAIRGHASSEILMNKTNTGYIGRKKPKYKNIESSSNILFMTGFDFVIATEQDVNGVKMYYAHNLNSKLLETGDISRSTSSINRSPHSTPYIILDYSEEAHNYFIKLASIFADMVDKMADFFGEEDTQKVLNHIQRSAGLLAMPLHNDQNF